MNKEKIYTDKAPQISISCFGDLVIRASPEAAISPMGSDFEVNEGETGYSIVSQGSLKLMVPEDSQLSISHVSGDLAMKRISGGIHVLEASSDVAITGCGSVTVDIVHADIAVSHLNGRLQVNTVHGDAVVRHVADVEFGTVHSDVAARYVNGDFTLQQAHGDISLRTVNGDVLIRQGQRDANLRNLGSQTVVENVQGDIRLYGSLSADEHRLHAEQDIILRWPVDAPLNLTAQAPVIKNRLPLADLVEKEGMLTGRIGDGKTDLSLMANGRIVLKEGQVIDDQWGFDFESETPDFDFAVEMEGLGAQIQGQILDQVSRITSDLEGKFGPEFTERISDKIARKAEKAAAKAERAAARAAERAERAAERARRRAELNMRRSPGRPPTPKKPPKQKATSEEQLKILRMVEKGIITPDEATTLLDALES